MSSKNKSDFVDLLLHRKRDTCLGGPDVPLTCPDPCALNIIAAFSTQIPGRVCSSVASGALFRDRCEQFHSQSHTQMENLQVWGQSRVAQ